MSLLLLIPLCNVLIFIDLKTFSQYLKDKILVYMLLSLPLHCTPTILSTHSPFLSAVNLIWVFIPFSTSQIIRVAS